MVTKPTRPLPRASERACHLPYVAECEAIHEEFNGVCDPRWWHMSQAGAFEAEAMLAMEEKRRER